MGQINAAWAVLGDAQQRRVYDGRGASSTATPPRSSTRQSRGFEAGPRATSWEPEAEPSYHVSTPGCALLSPLPLLLVFGLLAGIFVFTAYATSSTSPGDRSRVPSGRTDLAAYQIGSCVVFYGVTSEGVVQPVVVPCDGGHTAIVRRVGAGAVACMPDETKHTVPDTDVPVCVVLFRG